MKRICIFNDHWISGGIESFFYNILTNIDMTNLKIDIVVCDLQESIFTEPLRKKGITFIELPGNIYKGIFKNMYYFRKLIKQNKYDILHLNVSNASYLPLLYIAKKEGISVRIAHSHNVTVGKSHLTKFLLTIQPFLKNIYTKYATDLWACSKDAANFMFSNKILQNKGFKFIPNAINTELFRFNNSIRENIRKEFNLNNYFVIGNVARLDDCQKNQSFLIDVFAKVLLKNPNSLLILVGDGNDEYILREKVKQLKIEDKVIFYGISSRVEQLLCAMDIFVFPSKFEGLGISVIEAQASGLLTICSENIPNEANISTLFKQIPLSLGTTYWADQLIQLQQEIQYRSERDANIVKNNGFDLFDLVKVIEAFYNN